VTLLVGIRCSEDAVVLAADGAATFGGIAGHTVKQPTRKISIVAPTAVIATSGPVGLGQRLAGELADAGLLDAVSKMEPWQAMTFLRKKFFDHIGVELSVATQAKALGQVAFSSALSHTLVALVVRESPRLFQFD
jgi:20S proteasome alpha/beta subunit